MLRQIRTMATQSSLGPLEQVIRSKLTTALAPSLLEVHNDSHMHRHHAAMANSTSPETHFRITVVSDTFDGQRLAARHRVVYGLLRDEMAREGGIHALQLRLKTRAEEVRDREGGVAGTRAETCRNKTGER